MSNSKNSWWNHMRNIRHSTVFIPDMSNKHILSSTYCCAYTVQRVPSICCTSLNSQPSIVQQLHCSDAKLADHMSLYSFCAHWGKKKDALEHCNHAESTTEGRRVSSLPSSRCETQYSVYSVTTAFFFQLLLNAEARWQCAYTGSEHVCQSCVFQLIRLDWFGLDTLY